MRVSRRRLLSGCTAGVAFFGGCLGRGDSASLGATEQSETTTTEMDDTSSTTTKTYDDTISTTRTVERDGVEYVRKNDSVRFVSAYRSVRNGTDEPPERKPVYDSIPFERWAETECASAGAKAVNRAMERRLGTADGLAAGISTDDGRQIIILSYRRWLDTDGELMSKPDIPFERVKRAAPTRARATVSIAGRKHTSIVPVKTRKETVQLT